MPNPLLLATHITIAIGLTIAVGVQTAELARIRSGAARESVVPTLRAALVATLAAAFLMADRPQNVAVALFWRLVLWQCLPTATHPVLPQPRSRRPRSRPRRPSGPWPTDAAWRRDRPAAGR